MIPGVSDIRSFMQWYVIKTFALHCIGVTPFAPFLPKHLFIKNVKMTPFLHLYLIIHIYILHLYLIYTLSYIYTL